jgi:hypothetical protein
MITYESNDDVNNKLQNPISCKNCFNEYYLNHNFEPPKIIPDKSEDSFFYLYENQYKYLSKSHVNMDISNESLGNSINIFLKIMSNLEKRPTFSAEGFLEKAVMIAKKVIRAIILIVKAIIGWIRTIILNFGKFVSNKIFHKIFGQKRSKDEIANISKAYDKYSKASICNPFKNQEKRMTQM